MSQTYSENEIMTYISNMRANGMDTKKLEEDLDTLAKTSVVTDRFEIVSKISEEINKNIDYYKLLSYDNLLKDLSMVSEKKIAFSKVVEILKELEKISFNTKNQYKDLIKSIYSKIYYLLKIEVGLGNYNILFAVKNCEYASTYLSELLLEEVNKLNNSTNKIEGLDKLNVMISERRTKGLFVNYIDLDIVKSLVFISNYAPNKERYTKAVNDIKSEVSLLDDKLKVKFEDLTAVDNYKSYAGTSAKKHKDIRANITNKKIALALSTLLFFGAGVGIYKGFNHLFRQEVVVSDELIYQDGNALPIKQTRYLPKNKQELTKLITEYTGVKKTSEGNYYKYERVYDVTEVELNSPEEYLNFDAKFYGLKPIKDKLQYTTENDTESNIKYYSIVSQDFSTMKYEDNEARLPLMVISYVALVFVIIFANHSPLGYLVDLVDEYKASKNNKKEYEEFCKKIEHYYKLYEPQILKSKELQEEYNRLINNGMKMYVDGTLTEEIDKLMAELKEKTDGLEKTLRLENE